MADYRAVEKASIKSRVLPSYRMNAATPERRRPARLSWRASHVRSEAVAAIGMVYICAGVTLPDLVLICRLFAP
jgi:hypothetical protein